MIDQLLHIIIYHNPTEYCQSETVFQTTVQCLPRILT